MSRWEQPGGYPQIVRGQLDMSGNLMRVEHIYRSKEVLSHWAYGTYVYFLDYRMPIVVTIEDVLDHYNPLPIGRNDRYYQRGPGENFNAPSDSLPFVKALKSREVSTRP